MTSDESTKLWVDAPCHDRVPSLSPYRQYSTARLSFPRPDEFSRLAFAQAAILVNVAVVWGHPEDAISVGLVLYAALAVQDGKSRRGAWLLGVAVAFQPLGAWVTNR